MTHPIHWFHNGETIRSFLKKFDTHPRNPFIGRAAGLAYGLPNEDQEEMMEYKDWVRRLLERFGSGLRVLSINELTAHVSSFDNLAHRLRNVIELVPGLEELEFDVDLGDDGAADNDNYGKVVPFTPSEEEPEPLIRKLKSLHFKYSSQDYAAVERKFVMELQNMVFRMCAHPDSLTNVSCTGLPPVLLNFPKLESARIAVNTRAGFSNFAKASWPHLSKLVLSSDSGKFPNLFDVIGHFKDTLTYLCVRDCWSYAAAAAASKQLWQFRVDLPRLQHFETNRVVSFDSFVNLSNLEVIRLDMEYLAGVEFRKDETTGFTSFCERVGYQVLRTRIWEVLPKLGTVEVSLNGGMGSGRDTPQLHYLSRGENESEFRRKI